MVESTPNPTQLTDREIRQIKMKPFLEKVLRGEVRPEKPAVKSVPFVRP